MDPAEGLVCFADILLIVATSHLTAKLFCLPPEALAGTLVAASVDKAWCCLKSQVDTAYMSWSARS